MAKFSARLQRSRLEKPRSREPSQPALSLWTHQKFYKGFRGNARFPSTRRAQMERLLARQASFPDIYAVESLLRYTLPLKTVISSLKIFLFELLYTEARGHTVYTRLVITRKGLHLAPF